MYDPYFLRILMQELDREILKALGRGSYHTYRRCGGSGVSNRIARQLLSTLVRLKAIAWPKRSRQQATEVKGRYESWKKEFS